MTEIKRSPSTLQWYVVHRFAVLAVTTTREAAEAAARLLSGGQEELAR